MVALALGAAACGRPAAEGPVTFSEPIAVESPSPPQVETEIVTAVEPPAAPIPREEVGPRIVRLGHLPRQGVVVDVDRAVWFVDLEGGVLVRLPDYSIEAHHTSPGRTVLRRGRSFYLLRPAAGLLRRVRKDAVERFVVYNEELHGVPPASRVHGHPEGSWHWAVESPDGSVVLAQWSGECEVPTAFLWSGNDSPGLPITGERNLSHAADSLALGWSFDGRAVALMREGLCSRGTHPPGVYLFSAPGVSELAFDVPRGSLARMWGSAGRVFLRV